MKKALIVGINNYNDVTVDGIKNAIKFATLLSGNKGQSESFKTKLVLNSISPDELISLIDNYFFATSEILLYFSGYGNVRENNGYLCFPDSRNENKILTLKKIAKLTNKLCSKKKVLIFDCFQQPKEEFNLIKEYECEFDNKTTILINNRNNLKNNLFNEVIFKEFEEKDSIDFENIKWEIAYQFKKRALYKEKIQIKNFFHYFPEFARDEFILSNNLISHFSENELAGIFFDLMIMKNSKPSEINQKIINEKNLKKYISFVEEKHMSKLLDLL